MNTAAENLILAMAHLDEAAIIRYTQDLIDAGCSADQIQEYINEGMRQVGEFFEKGEYFIADLMVSGTFYRMVLDMLPASEVTEKRRKGKILIGVVEKDLHDIGKDIVVASLEANGYQVTDLGYDVPAREFVEAVRREKPQILLLSGMMAPSLMYMKETIDALRDEGLRQNLHIILGGGCIKPFSKPQIGADAAAYELSETLKYCNAFFEGSEWSV